MAYSATPTYSNQDNSEIIEIVNGSVRDWNDAFSHNIENFAKSMKMNFEDPMTNATKQVLRSKGINPFTCNTLEAYISRMLGDFSFADMGIDVQEADITNDGGTSPIPSLMSAIFEEIFYKSDADTVQTQLMRNVLGGGYGVCRVRTRYVDDKSFSTEPVIENVLDPTLCGFDAMAQDVYKGDSDFCFEFVPYTKDDFEDVFGVDPSSLGIPGNYGNGALQWRKSNGNVDLYYVCDFYCKKRKSITIYKTPYGNLTSREYNKLIENTPANAPLAFADIKTYPSRRTQAENIYRYKVFNETLLEQTQTNLDKLPLVFFDGNSVWVDGKQITRSFTHNVMQAQQSKDILESKALDALMNQGTSKLLFPVAAVPQTEGLKEVWDNGNGAEYSRYPYVDYAPSDNGEPARSLPAPQYLPPEPISQELLSAKGDMDQLIQLGLGSFDAQQGNIGGSGSDLSGKAILAGAAQSNSAAKPYFINFASCFKQVIDILVDLIPGCYKEVQTFITTTSTGSKQPITLNGDNGDVQYSDLQPNKLNVYVSLGGSFEAQREKALQSLSQIASWNQGLAQLLSGQGLPALLENLDIVGKQEIISMAEQQLEQQQNQPQQPDPAMMKVQAQMEANQNTATKNANDFNIAQQEVNLRGQEIGIKAIATHGKVSNETARTQIKATAEANNAASDMEGTNLERDKMNFPTPDAKLDFMESMHGN